MTVDATRAAERAGFVVTKEGGCQALGAEGGWGTWTFQFPQCNPLMCPRGCLPAGWVVSRL